MRVPTVKLFVQCMCAKLVIRRDSKIYSHFVGAKLTPNATSRSATGHDRYGNTGTPYYNFSRVHFSKNIGYDIVTLVYRLYIMEGPRQSFA
jgi:hypothetical protein